MPHLNKIAFATAFLASFATPASAFFDELVIGMTSVTNNLIDSTESVTNNTVNTASATMLSLSSNPGKMADRIGVMADRIGFMADRIVTTEGIMAGLAHKIIDSNTQPRVIHQYASAYAAPAIPAPVQYASGYSTSRNGNSYTTGHAYAQAPVQQRVNANPYMASYAPAAAPVAVTPAQADNSRYSASYMIYGNTGATYTAARPAALPATVATPSGYGFAASSAVRTASQSCGISYGVRRSC